MHRLILALLALIAAPALASPSTFTLSGSTAPAGQAARFTINRTAGSGGQYVTLTTANGTAKAATDYAATNVTIHFGPYQRSAAVSVATFVDQAATGQTLSFTGSISVKGIAVSSAAAFIVEPAPPPPATQTCPDGTVILATSICPTAPPPPSTSADNPMTGLSPGVGAADIPTTDHDVMADLTNTGEVLSPVTNDVVGAFRFLCRHTGLRYDDPTVFPSQPGKSHLHDFTGNTATDAFSVYGSLRRAGGSGCNDVAGADGNLAESNWAANRTPYWQPALLDGKGNVILVDYTLFYYKRRPASDPVVSDPAAPGYEGHAVTLPNGLKFIFGNFPSDSSRIPDAPEGRVVYHCNTATADLDMDFASAVTCAKSVVGNRFGVRVEAPPCWDGINLDSADHRSHMAYGSYGGWGYYKCDAQHPYVIPTFTYAAWYTILPTDDGDIHWSSDEMDNTKPRGWSFHGDFGPSTWDPLVKAMWIDNCINKRLSCNGGDLGNGMRLKGEDRPPIYWLNGVATSLWQNPVRLVPMPAM